MTARELVSYNHYQVTSDHVGEVWPWRSYKTSQHTPPDMCIAWYGPRNELSEGYLFLSPTNVERKYGTHVSGIGYILTVDGDLVFAAEETRMDFCHEWIGGMTDFRVQTYTGKSYLTFWNGCNHFDSHWGHRWGRVTFVDEEYSNFTINPNLHIVSADDANEGQIDLHEHQMTDLDTMLVSSYGSEQQDLSSIGGPTDGWIYDSFFFEIDIQTEEVLFRWKALDHISLASSRVLVKDSKTGTKKAPLDWFHINSVQAVGQDYLISSYRHWTIYMISGKDGSILWQLDGANEGTLRNGQDHSLLAPLPLGFKTQHHARAHNVSEHGMTVSFFNNNVGNDSQALAFYIPLPVDSINPPALVSHLETLSRPIRSATMGSYQADLENGNALIGYGRMPVIREYGPIREDNRSSSVLWEAQFGHPETVQSYRVMKAAWHGTPKSWDPVAVIEEVRKNILPPRAYVSWNGATDVSSWLVHAGEDARHLKQIGIVEKKGFETSFNLDNKRCVQLGAIRNDRVLRWSNVACLESSNSGIAGFLTISLAIGCFIVIIIAGVWSCYCCRGSRPSEASYQKLNKGYKDQIWGPSRRWTLGAVYHGSREEATELIANLDESV